MTEDVDMHAEPSDTDWIRVTSTDGFSYMVKRKIANISGTMKSMLDTESSYTEAITRTVPVMQRGIIVEKMLEYMAFRAHYETVGPKEDIPVHEYMERLPPEIVLELLLAADYQEL
ncbi:BTB/POZ protein [Lyophyllum atratum]|nr:BTB/POZ protein [Lyophyllum atratum]